MNQTFKESKTTLIFTENCSMSWKHITGNEIPKNAIIGGFDIDKSPLYICRHTQNGDTIPGEANEKVGCAVTYAGKAIEYKTEYEVLIGDKYDWVPRHGGDAVPKHAFVAGTDASGGPIYIGRCDLHLGSAETEVVGKVHHIFYYAFGSVEHTDCSNHQIMIC
jgi:hypothetical protein